MSTTPEQTPDPPPVGPKPVPLTIVSIASLGTAVGLGTLQFAAPEIAKGIPSVFGTISSWISAGGIMGILALLVWYLLGNRKIGVEERLARNAERATDNADRADVRDHYAEEVATLRERFDQASVRHTQTITEMEARHANAVVEIEGKYRRLLHETEQHYKALLKETEDAHEECKRDRDSLRQEVGKMRDEIRGLTNQIRSQAADRVIALGAPGAAPPSTNVRRAAKRVKRIARDRGADKGRKP
jgi:hypothetical protein